MCLVVKETIQKRYAVQELDGWGQRAGKAVGLVFWDILKDQICKLSGSCSRFVEAGGVLDEADVCASVLLPPGMLENQEMYQ